MKLESLRRVTLESQGLSRANSFGKGPAGAKAALEQLGYVQIDTLAVVERAHHHVLRTRVSDYKTEYLNQLVHDGEAFEYWFHAAAFLPMRDYRFALRRMGAVRRGDFSWYGAESEAMTHVLRRIRDEGPLKARDFQSPKKKKGNWWNWKPMKHALEQLFMQGDLMIRERTGMEKIYDLTERVLPANVDTREPGLEEFAEHLVEGALRANGFARLKQITHLRPGADLRGAVETVLARKVDAGLLEEYRLAGPARFFAPAGFADAKPKAPSARVRLLSPFDNAVIHRERMESLFDFDYRLECYVPQSKRKFGYFCLPILYKDRFVGRVDCKAHRKESRLELIHLHVEKEIPDEDAFASLFAKAVSEFARFNNCSEVGLTKTSPRKWAAPIKRAIT